jgi:hypothetical protein
MHIDDYRGTDALINDCLKELRKYLDEHGTISIIGAWMIGYAIITLARVLLNVEGMD